jgi:hypothetical protein
VLHARGLLILGQKADFCAKRYDLDVLETLYSPVNGFINCAVKYFIDRPVDSNNLNSANLLLELRMVRDDLLEISNNVINSEDLQCLIEFICSSAQPSYFTAANFFGYQCNCLIACFVLIIGMYQCVRFTSLIVY